MFASRVINKRSRRAAAIMLALWALFLLSAMVISWALDLNTRLTISGVANRVLEAEAMACSGAEVAMHPAVKPGLDVLHGSFPPNQSYEARITGEAGRLNINRLLDVMIKDPAGTSPQSQLLEKYLEIKGVDLNERDHMIDCLLDWVEPDKLVRLNGAEDDEGYKPANMPLRTLDELKRVRGWEEFTSRADWDADFTLNTQTAQIDINWASRDVLLSLPGLTEGQVDRFLSLRRGPDDIEGTEDDVKFGVPSSGANSNNAPASPDIAVALGLRQDQFAQLQALITTADSVVRIVSVGKSAGVTRTVRMVVFKQGPNIRLLSWKEY
jgi:type II secretory pathway component PulK